MANIKIDNNYKGVSAGITDDVNETIESLRVDPVTKRLLTDASITVASVTVSDGTISSGTVTANLSATDNAVLDAIAAGYATEGAALGSGVLIQGDDGTDRTNVLVDVAGHLQVDVLSGGGAGTQYTEDEVSANPQVGNAIMVERDDALAAVTPLEGDWIGLRGTAEGALWTQDFNSDAMVTDLAAIEVLLGTIDTDTGNIATDAAAIEVLLGTIDTDTGNIAAGYATEGSALGSGVLLQGDDGTDRTNVLVDVAGHLQVDVLSAPSTTVTASDLDIRSLTSASDSVLVYGSDDGGTTKRVIETDSGGAVAIQDGGNTITVDGTVTANLAAGSNNIGDVDVLSLPASTNTIEVVGDAAENAVAAGNPVLVGGRYDAAGRTLGDTDVGAIALAADGAVHIDDGGNTITVDGTVTANLGDTDNAVLDNIALYTSGSETALELLDNAVDGSYLNVNLNMAGTDAAAGEGVISAQTQRVTLATDDDAVAHLSNIVGDTTAIETAVQLIDNSIYVDDADWTADTSSHTLAGGVTQAVPTANTDGDTTPLITNSLRELRMAYPESDLALAATKHVKKYYTSAGAATDGIIWSPAAGTRWYLTLLTINVSAAATVTIEDDLGAGDSPVYKAEFAANSGVVLSFPTPMFSGEDAADLTITTTAGNCYVTAVGYEI